MPNQLQQVREAIIKAIGEESLKQLCRECHGSGEVGPYDEHNGSRCMSCMGKGFWLRGLTLEDVLRAIGKEKLFEVTNYFSNLHEIVYNYWTFGKSLDDQPLPTLNFLSSIIGK